MHNRLIVLILCLSDTPTRTFCAQAFRRAPKSTKMGIQNGKDQEYSPLTCSMNFEASALGAFSLSQDRI